jgi:ATP-dependent DNA ligase
VFLYAWNWMASICGHSEATGAGIQFNEHIEEDGATIFQHACKLGFERIVSKHRDHPYRSGPSKAWIKVKNPTAPGVLRFEDRT